MCRSAVVEIHMTTLYENQVLKGNLEPLIMSDLANRDLYIVLNLAKKLTVPLSFATDAARKITCEFQIRQ
jgi:3-hydroxyisobutyrate dehydrogenase-like beta-hydroxyacid dehydrogenase